MLAWMGIDAALIWERERYKSNCYILTVDWPPLSLGIMVLCLIVPCSTAWFVTELFFSEIAALNGSIIYVYSGQSASTVEWAQSCTLSNASNETQFVAAFSLAHHNVLLQFESFLQSDHCIYFSVLSSCQYYLIFWLSFSLFAIAVCYISDG